MKKLLIGLFIFGFIAISAPQVQASTLSDALLKIQNLTKEISQLKIKLKASVLGSSLDSQTIILKTGWNIISFNVNPSDLSLNSVFASMNPDNGEIITNEDAVTATYMNGSWGGGFTTIDTSKAYKIKVSRDKTLTVDGNLISINSSISLRSGTNLVPYYPTVEIDAVKAFSSIKTTCLKKVMDESGKTYEDFGVFGGWKNNIGTLKPGEGYTIITTGSCILNYGDVNKTSSITVLSPNGGETYTAGQQVIVKWKTENIPSNDKVIVVLDGESYDGYNMSGSDGTLNDGIETYYLYPNDKTINGRFKIRVLSINNDNLLDLSDNYFTIKPNLDTTTTPIAKITPTSDLTPRISYWSGKVNQHVNVGGGIWQTDPDGTSGATIDKLTYCKKWYPNTTSVVEYKNETINSWHDAGNVNDYQNTRMSYRCAETTIDIGCANGQVYSSTTGAKCLNNSTPSLTVLSPNGGETYNAGDKVIVKWKSTGYSSNSKIAVDLATTDSSGSSSNTHLMSVSNLDDDGVETLTIPNDVKTGSNYVLVFTIFETSTKWQMAKSNLFTINSTIITDTGCSNGAIYSSTTGQKCTETHQERDTGCINGQNYSSTTGKLCALGLSSTHINRTLKWGMTGDDVKTLQEFLDLYADGIFGRGTMAKVKEWQAAHGLNADGSFGSMSREKAGFNQ